MFPGSVDFQTRSLSSHFNNSIVRPISIVDAKDSGMTCDEVQKTVKAIAVKELKGEQGIFESSHYVKTEYFNGNSVKPGIGSPETILLAKTGNDVVGFIITEKREESKYIYNSKNRYSTATTDYVAYIAVDSTVKNSGIGTKLMLTAMQKTKETGKRYLTLTYTAAHLDGDDEKCKTRIGFYNSFKNKFGIPMKERGNDFSCGHLMVRPYYDLYDVDFDSILK